MEKDIGIHLESNKILFTDDIVGFAKKGQTSRISKCMQYLGFRVCNDMGNRKVYCSIRPRTKSQTRPE